MLACAAFALAACGSQTQLGVKPPTGSEPTDQLPEPAPTQATTVDAAADDAVEAPADPTMTLTAARSVVESAARGAVPPPPWRCSREEWVAARDRDNEDAFTKTNLRESAVEWRRNRTVRSRVGKGLGHYRAIRPLYIRRGICDVARFIAEGIKLTTFLGRPVWIHVGAAEALAEAEAMIAEHEKGRPSFSRVGSFNARTIRGPYGNLPWLSNHAMGLAIDFDAHKNPYLSLSDLAAIRIVTGLEIERRSDVSAGARWDSFKAAEKAWQARIGPWLRDNYGAIAELRVKVRRNEASDADKSHLEELERERKLVTSSRHLTADRRRGFISLPRHFVVAMEEVGFVWATDFSTGADIMHFEYREHRQARKPRRGG